MMACMESYQFQAKRVIHLQAGTQQPIMGIKLKLQTKWKLLQIRHYTHIGKKI